MYDRSTVRGSVYLEDVYTLGYMDESSEEEEEPQVHKGWLKMNPIAERKSAWVNFLNVGNINLLYIRWEGI